MDLSSEAPTLWTAWHAAGFDVPQGTTELVAGRLDTSAPGIDVSAAQIVEASPAEAAVLAERAADPEVVRVAARDHRHSVAVAAVRNPRCPSSAVRDVALGASPPPALTSSTARRLDPDELVALIAHRGPVLIDGGGWEVTFSDAQLLTMISAVPPSQTPALCELLVWPAIGHWVRHGAQDPFDHRAVCAAAASRLDPDVAAEGLVSAVADALDGLVVLDEVAAARLCELELTTRQGLGLGSAVASSCVVTPDAVAVLADTDDMSLYERALAEHRRLDSHHLTPLATAAVRGDAARRAEFAGVLRDDLGLWDRLEPSTRRAVAEMFASSGTPFGVAHRIVGDPAVPEQVRATIFGHTITPALQPTPTEAASWAAFVTRHAGVSPPDSAALRRAVIVAEATPALCALHPETIYTLFDALVAVPSDELSDATFNFAEVLAVAAAVTPPDERRVAAWVTRFSGLAEAVAAGRLVTTLSPRSATEVLAATLDKDRLDGERRAPKVAVAFAALVDADTVGARLLGSLEGVAAELVAARRPAALAPLARRLSDAGADAAVWRLAAELAVGWPGSLDELVATATCAT